MKQGEYDVKLEPVLDGAYPKLQDYVGEQLVGLPLMTILMIVSVGMQALFYLWQCRRARVILRRMALCNGPISQTYLRHKVYVPLIRAGIPEADAERATQALRMAFVEGHFDGG
jgi:hypothetical protein